MNTRCGSASCVLAPRAVTRSTGVLVVLCFRGQNGTVINEIALLECVTMHRLMPVHAVLHLGHCFKLFSGRRAGWSLIATYFCSCGRVVLGVHVIEDLRGGGLQVELANDCAFGLGSACFAGSQARAQKVGQEIQAGMFVANDFSSNAMCQSLPFGGIKESGFDR